ncbi:MAG: TA system VapC family ribonuclease toxin [Candidatus Latescibacterota bacterium]
MILLDVNLLVALCDADHVHHRQARSWFRTSGDTGWATCPLTENGLLRVMGNLGYPGGPGSPAEVRPLLQHLRSLPGHQFWDDDISPADKRALPSLEGISAKQLTDVYLLALAVHHGGTLASLDSRIDPSLVPGGRRALVVISR